MSSPLFLSSTASILIAILPFVREKISRAVSFIFSIIILLGAFFMYIDTLAVLDEILSLEFMGSVLILVSALSSCLILFSGSRFHAGNKLYQAETYPLICLMSSGLMFALSFKNVFGVYLSFEMASVVIYAIIALNRTPNPVQQKISAEGAAKYFMIGAVVSAISVYGISILYGFSPETGIVMTLSSSSYPIMLGMVLFMFSLLFKSSIFPFHFWTMDVYQSANNAVVLLLANVTKISAVFVLYKVVYSLLSIDLGIVFNSLLTVLSVSAVLGAIGGVMQNNLKRIAAYSGIANISFGAVLVLVNNPNYVALYFAVYSMMNIGFFALMELLSRNKGFSDDVSDVAGLGKVSPVVASAFTVILLSMAGIPPLAGFFIKIMPLSALVNSSLAIHTGAFALSSAISVFYYIKIIKAMYTDEISPVLSVNLVERPMRVSYCSLPLFALIAISVVSNIAVPIGILLS